MKVNRLITQVITVLSFSFFAAYALAQSAVFEAGKDFKVLPKEMAQGPLVLTDPKKTEVLEFFSYGCPACNSVEVKFEEWSKTQNKTIEIKKVPVVFFNGWDELARAYYMAKVLGINNKVDRAVFDAIHKDRIPLTNEAELRKFFEKHGVSADTFNKNFNSFPVARFMLEGNELQKHYQIISVPTVIVGSQYQTDLAMTDGDVDRFMAIIDFLIQKHQASAK